MKNSDYWKLRFGQLEAAQNKLASNGRAEIERLYREATKELEGKINTWYTRLAANNGVSMAEARKMLSASELAEFKWDVHDYIKYGQENALSGQWVKQLENASAKFHISKYEALKIQTQQSLESLFAKQSGITSSTMKEVYQSGYYHTAFEVQKGFGVGWDISGIDQAQIEKVIAKPWAVDEKNFSERIWSNKQKLISEVHNELTQNIITGADPQKAINAIASKLNASKSNAGRLVMTEEAYFSSAAQKDCFDDLGVEEYEIVATLDAYTSEICQSMDGKHFPMKDFQAGVTAPPFHPWCRSTTCPYFADNFGEPGERAARDQDGKTYYVPADMNYQEWKKTFVEGGDKSGFDVYNDGSGVHYTKHVEPEPAPPPKKEYLTKKKLQSKIADADVQIEELQQQADDILSDSGFSFEDVKQAGGIDDFYKDATTADSYYKASDEIKSFENKYGSIDELIAKGTDADILKSDQLGDIQIKAEAELKKQGFSIDKLGNVDGISKDNVKAALKEKEALEKITSQMEDLEQQKAEWQEKLDTKIKAEQKKAFVKKQIELQDKLLQFDTDKTYKGIWYNDDTITIKDWAAKQGSIEGKKKYFDGKFISETDPDLMKKYQDLYNQLLEFDTEGKSYYEIQSELKKIQSDLQKLEKSDIINAVDDAFSQERKDAALWAKATKDADEKLRSVCGDVWKSASKAEKDAIYDYTTSYHKFNEPLRGIEYGSEKFLGVGNVDFDQIGVSYCGYKPGQMRQAINAMTDIIERSTYDFDMWMQRGCDYSGMDKFFEIPMSKLQNASQIELQELVGNTVTEYAFCSCGVSKGKGFSNKSIILNIYAPKGTQMMYAEPFSRFGLGAGRKWNGIDQQSAFGSEAEIILQQGTSFRITKVEKSNGKLYFDLEVIEQNPQR